jgi:hypothetical protein
MEVGSTRRGPVRGACAGRCAGSGLWTCVVVDRDNGASAGRSGLSGPCRTTGGCCGWWGMIAGGGMSFLRLEDGPGAGGPSEGVIAPSVRLRVSFDAAPPGARLEDEAVRWCARDVAGRGWGSTRFGGTVDMEDVGRFVGIVFID